MTERTVGIVGGGIVGLAVGRELTRRHESTRVVVFEKENRLGAHQTGHNSGVVHAGLYYEPGSLKAELCARGRSMLREYCSERGLPYVECGKLVVAVDGSELARFDALEANARRNGVPGLRRVAGSGITEIEPHAAGVAALHSPETAITDYAAVARALGEDIERAGGSVLLSTAVTGVRRRVGGVDVETADGIHSVDRLVVCAGLRADRVSRWADGADEPRIVPFRGEYMRLAPSVRELVRGMIYPVPDPRYPFLGVHFTRRVSGEVEVGPNAVLSPHREGYRRRDVSLEELRGMAGWPGFWRMARQHWRTGALELLGSLSVRAYMRTARRYVPEVGVTDVRRAGAGIRAQAVDRDGSLVDDFRINHEDGITTVRNAPSPAATSSLAIAEHVVDRVAAS
ncbi:L-2-hydroxyglutarate oxidase LhgO [Actinopolyspora alba]|uniref:L-2-hydroxyglutarate oxidase LhgO n=1 Tax=Actinopolyspora alba TaxID=673379 RepID=A0A1I1XLJ5_9ACTN|nr:L-2-hydroxyglutarate oxidase [Actinopolyspora alba]SFE06633.1 L-2-hydroxyglutarate oxidase LhgO [Actinopolyspora alba]